MIFHPPGCACLVCAAKARAVLPVKHAQGVKHQGVKHPLPPPSVPAESPWVRWGRLGGKIGGLKGGRVGGPARAAALSPTRRREIARQGARARWGDAPST